MIHGDNNGSNIELNPISRNPNNKKSVKLYQMYESKNLHLFKGRTTTTILLFSIFECPFIYSQSGIFPVIVFAYFSLLSITSMFITALMDPGIIPRNLDAVADKEEPYYFFNNNNENNSNNLLGVNFNNAFNRPENVPLSANIQTEAAESVNSDVSQTTHGSRLLTSNPESSRRVIVSQKIIPYDNGSTSTSGNTHDYLSTGNKSKSADQISSKISKKSYNILKPFKSNKSTIFKYNENLPPPFPIQRSYSENQQDDSNMFYYPSATKEVVIKGIPFTIKYCDTCKIYRPPRCSHCRICDNCVEVEDHHCVWLNNCIGKRNYRYFYTFVASTAFSGIYIFAYSLYHLVYLAKNSPDFADLGIGTAISSTPVSLFLVIYTLFLTWSVIGLFLYHTYLIVNNMTTHEQIKSNRGFCSSSDESSPHAFSNNSTFLNCLDAICKPRTSPNVYWKAKVTTDDLSTVIVKS
ncbi:putative palmitoyltransferase ZDHHC14 [Smittium culicis]|uniref:Palmitoyltransferase n=1 Tax=Smittium culicis TaxID=133412 RepID=A0A1R1YB35_9FUNG|nr:putative palmitoyltransferase ZDHHC14 [Smittium culicis]